MILKQLFYSLYDADEMGIREHPQDQMKNLGYNIIHSVPQSLYDGWWFTVEELIEPLPDYLHEIQYNLHYWKDDCWKQCEYFNIHDGHGPLCCYGGRSCIKEMNPEEIKKRKLQYDQQNDFWKNHTIDKIESATLVFEDGSEVPIKI